MKKGVRNTRPSNTQAVSKFAGCTSGRLDTRCIMQRQSGYEYPNITGIQLQRRGHSDRPGRHITPVPKNASTSPAPIMNVIFLNIMSENKTRLQVGMCLIVKELMAVVNSPDKLTCCISRYLQEGEHDHDFPMLFYKTFTQMRPRMTRKIGNNVTQRQNDNPIGGIISTTPRPIIVLPDQAIAVITTSRYPWLDSHFMKIISKFIC